MTAKRYHQPEVRSTASPSGKSKLFRVDDSVETSLAATATTLNFSQNTLANAAIGSFLALPDEEKIAVIDRYYSETRDAVRTNHDEAIDKLAGKKGKK